MITPPHPGFERTTLDTVGRLKWAPVTGDVGEIVGGWLAIAGCADGAALWCAGEQQAPVGLAPRFIAREAFVALREGELQQDGALLWYGERWHLADVSEGGHLVARLAKLSQAA